MAVAPLQFALNRLVVAGLLLGAAAAAPAEEAALPGVVAVDAAVAARDPAPVEIASFAPPAAAGSNTVAVAPSTLERAAPQAAAPEVPVRWVTSSEWSGRRYRWSLQRGSLDIGLAFEPRDAALRPLDEHNESAAPLVPTLPTLSLGVRRVGRGEGAAASSLLERALDRPGEGGYTSRVGIEWKPAQSQLNFLRDGLGVRLDGNDRMSVRLRKGVLSVYVQRKF
jgi:hypothetical protein